VAISQDVLIEARGFY